MCLHPQVKALLHEGAESPHRRSLIPPVTFEVSGRVLVFHSWRLGTILVPVEGQILAQLSKGKEPNTEGSGWQSHRWRMGTQTGLCNLRERLPREGLLSPRCCTLVLLQMGAVSDIRQHPLTSPRTETSCKVVPQGRSRKNI